MTAPTHIIYRTNDDLVPATSIDGCIGFYGEEPTMQSSRIFYWSAALLSAAVLAACGGGGGGGGITPTTQTGVFVDAPVAGLCYSAAPSGTKGSTNAAGEYGYVAGDTVTFAIPAATGNCAGTTIALGAVAASAQTFVLSLPNGARAAEVLNALNHGSTTAMKVDGLTVPAATVSTLADYIINGAPAGQTNVSLLAAAQAATTAAGNFVMPVTATFTADVGQHLAASSVNLSSAFDPLSLASFAGKTLYTQFDGETCADALVISADGTTWNNGNVAASATPGRVSFTTLNGTTVEFALPKGSSVAVGGKLNYFVKTIASGDSFPASAGTVNLVAQNAFPACSFAASLGFQMDNATWTLSATQVYVRYVSTSNNIGPGTLSALPAGYQLCLLVNGQFKTCGQVSDGVNTGSNNSGNMANRVVLDFSSFASGGTQICAGVKSDTGNPVAGGACFTVNNDGSGPAATGSGWALDAGPVN